MDTEKSIEGFDALKIDNRTEGLRILSPRTREIAYRPDVSRDSRGRKKSTRSAVCWIGSQHAVIFDSVSGSSRVLGRPSGGALN